ncbi:MAG: hypothetical protein ACK55I_28165, partial [bacterium]
MASVGRHRQRRGVQAGEDLLRRRVRRGLEVDDRHGALAGDVADRVHPHRGAAAGRTGQVIRTGPAPAPVAHIGRVAHEDHVIRGDADTELAQDLAGLRLELEQAVREVGAHVE